MCRSTACLTRRMTQTSRASQRAPRSTSPGQDRLTMLLREPAVFCPILALEGAAGGGSRGDDRLERNAADTRSRLSWRRSVTSRSRYRVAFGRGFAHPVGIRPRESSPSPSEFSVVFGCVSLWGGILASLVAQAHSDGAWSPLRRLFQHIQPHKSGVAAAFAWVPELCTVFPT